jgi:hypothetical protein
LHGGDILLLMQVWAAGSSVEVGFTVKASHGGGYSYRLCPANETLDE